MANLSGLTCQACGAAGRNLHFVGARNVSCERCAPTLMLVGEVRRASVEGLGAWLPEDGAPGSLFNLDRSGGPVRLSDVPSPKRSFWQRVRDAWAGAINGWKWGGT